MILDYEVVFVGNELFMVAYSIKKTKPCHFRKLFQSLSDLLALVTLTLVRRQMVKNVFFNVLTEAGQKLEDNKKHCNISCQFSGLLMKVRQKPVFRKCIKELTTYCDCLLKNGIILLLNHVGIISKQI